MGRLVCWDMVRNEPCNDPGCRAERPDLHVDRTRADRDRRHARRDTAPDLMAALRASLKRAREAREALADAPEDCLNDPGPGLPCQYHERCIAALGNPLPCGRPA